MGVAGSGERKTAQLKEQLARPQTARRFSFWFMRILGSSLRLTFDEIFGVGERCALR